MLFAQWQPIWGLKLVELRDVIYIIKLSNDIFVKYEQFVVFLKNLHRKSKVF